MASWGEQYDRVIRWYERCAVIEAGRVHDVSTDNYVDEVYAFFQNCYHLKDWIKNDPAVGVNWGQPLNNKYCPADQIITNDRRVFVLRKGNVVQTQVNEIQSHPASLFHKG